MPHWSEVHNWATSVFGDAKNYWTHWFPHGHPHSSVFTSTSNHAATKTKTTTTTTAMLYTTNDDFEPTPAAHPYEPLTTAVPTDRPADQESDAQDQADSEEDQREKEEEERERIQEQEEDQREKEEEERERIQEQEEEQREKEQEEEEEERERIQEEEEDQREKEEEERERIQEQEEDQREKEQEEEEEERERIQEQENGQQDNKSDLAIDAFTTTDFVYTVQPTTSPETIDFATLTSSRIPTATQNISPGNTTTPNESYSNPSSHYVFLFFALGFTAAILLYLLTPVVIRLFTFVYNVSKLVFGSKGSFSEDSSMGLTSESFDLVQNIDGDDNRGGLSKSPKIRILFYMLIHGETFDEARFRYVRYQFAQNGIAPDGQPLDPKFVNYA